MNDPDRLMADLASDDPTVVAAATDRLLALTGGTPSGSQLARASIAAKEALYAQQRQHVDHNGIYHPPAEPNDSAESDPVAEMFAVAEDLEAAGHSDRAEQVRARAEQLLNQLHAPGSIDQGVRGHTVPAPTFDEAIEAARAAGDWERHDQLVLENLARKIAST